MRTNMSDLKKIVSMSRHNKGLKVSTFVPLKGMDMPPAKIFFGLRKVAYKLAAERKVSLSTPLINWDHWSKSGTQTLGIYELEDEVYLVPLSFLMPPRVIVSNTFHIKPLILEEDYSAHALVLHFNQTGAGLYIVGLNTCEQVCRYFPPVRRVIPDWPYLIGHDELADFLSSVRSDVQRWVTRDTLFISVTGCENPRLRPIKFWNILSKPVLHPLESFYKDTPRNSLPVIRHHIRRSIDKSHLESTMKLHIVSDQIESWLKYETALSRINERTINSLCVSLEDLKFGKYDKDGRIQLTRQQSDSQDDDILDDLAEEALSNGIRVKVVPKKFLPIGEQILVG